MYLDLFLVLFHFHARNLIQMWQGQMLLLFSLCLDHQLSNFPGYTFPKLICHRQGLTHNYMAPKLQYLKERTTILYFLGFNFSHQLSVEQYSYSQTILNKKNLESTQNSNLSPWIFCVTRNPHIPLLASHFPILYESLRTFYLILNWVSFLPAKLDPNCQWVQVISYWNIHFFPSTCKINLSSCWYNSEFNFYHSLG